jgi:predicted enzyme related to lactoylglutathione lyase
MRKNMAEMGAPERFEDVVAAITPIEDGPAYWSVTFAVDDADAIAASAAELGGHVVSPPTEAPWVRTTVITDPQGAAFTASQFKPENRDLEPSAGASAAA